MDFQFQSFVKCISYNVVMIGDSRVGKSTFIQLLQKPIIDTFFEPYRGTIIPEIIPLFYDYKNQIDSKYISLNILDTPGLNEVSEFVRPNIQIKDIISEHIKDNFTSIDLILITIQYKGITDNVIKTIFEIKDYFGNKYLNNMCLLITHADNFEIKHEQEYIQKLNENDTMADLLTAVNNNVLFTGKNAHDNTKNQDLKFEEEQMRRKQCLFDILFKTIKTKLKNENELQNICPIDILESARITNEIIISLSGKNKNYYDEINFYLSKIKNLNLYEDDRNFADHYIENVGEDLEKIILLDTTIEEKSDALKYNEIEIPLKKKALLLKNTSFQIQSQLKATKDAYSRLKLKEFIPPSPTPPIPIPNPRPLPRPSSKKQKI